MEPAKRRAGMPSLTIKNIPAPLVRRLKTRAVANRRSLNHEVIVCLEAAAGSVSIDPETLLARARALRAKTADRFRLTDRMLARLKQAGRS
jgi:antitoxin FitA